MHFQTVIRKGLRIKGQLRNLAEDYKVKDRTLIFVAAVATPKYVCCITVIKQYLI